MCVGGLCPYISYLATKTASPIAAQMLHKKHSPMETIAHAVLFYSLASTATFAALESGFQHQPLLTAGRVTGMFLQGAWFIAAARLLYGGTAHVTCMGASHVPMQTG